MWSGLWGGTLDCCHPERSEGSAASLQIKIKSRAFTLSRESLSLSGESNQRPSAPDTRRLRRFPALLSKNGPARTRTSMCSNMRALLPLLLPVLGSLYGAKSKSKATKLKADRPAALLDAALCQSAPPCFPKRRLPASFLLLIDRLPNRLKFLRPRRYHARAAGREVHHFAFASIVAVRVVHA